MSKMLTAAATPKQVRALYLDDNMAEAIEVTRNRGECHNVGFSFWCCLSDRHLPHVDGVEASLLKVVGSSFRLRDWCKMVDYCLYRFSEFGEMVK